jgi:serine/threonine protein phosphatase PrpC
VDLLTIGAFARAAGLTPKALRLYAGLGLLPPAAVDPESGYRYYEPGQLDRARLIAGLRRVGMPLAEIGAVCDLDPSAAAAAVTAYWQRVSAATASRADDVAVLVDRLSGKGTAAGTAAEPAVRSAARCDIGSGRETNEDAVYAGDRLLAVADGVAGPSGATAARAAINALKPFEGNDEPAAALLTSLAAAVDDIDRTVRGAGDRAATTLTAVLRRGARLAIVHIGDTRAYLLRGGELAQLTQDHTVVQARIDRGERAPARPPRALLTRALGAGGQHVEADLALRTALPGDRYLLCSDGLSAIVDRHAMRSALASAPEPGEAVDRLVELAYAAGAPDNIACVVAHIGH